MNTKKEKPIQRAYPLGVDTVQRPVLLEAQKFLSDEIDEWSKMLDHANSPFKVRPFVGVEPIEKRSWLNQAKKRLHKKWE